jgi:tetratricopeptide (TPR) repeat protein
MKEEKKYDKEKKHEKEKHLDWKDNHEEIKKPDHDKKNHSSSSEKTFNRRVEIAEVLRNISKSQHNDHYELRSLLDVKLEQISSLLTNFPKDLDSKLEEEFSSLREVIQLGFENNSDDIRKNPEKMLQKIDELQKTFTGKVDDSVDILSNGISHVGEIFEKLEGSFKEEINALRETLQKVFEEMYREFKDSSKGLKELSTLIEKYVADIKEEREKFEKRRKKEEARHLNDLAVKNFYGGRVEMAVRQLKEAVLLDDSSLEILTNLAVALSRAGKQTDARKIFEKVLKDKPDLLEAQVGLGLIMFEKGNIDEAIEIFKEAVKKDGEEAFVYANLGYAYEQKEMIDKAVTNWGKAIELDPTLKDVEEKLKLYKDKEV